MIPLSLELRIQLLEAQLKELKRLRALPIWRANMAKARETTASDEYVREYTAQARREALARQRGRINAIIRSPEMRAKTSAKSKAMWADPEKKAQILAAQKAGKLAKKKAGTLKRTRSKVVKGKKAGAMRDPLEIELFGD